MKNGFPNKLAGGILVISRVITHTANLLVDTANWLMDMSEGLNRLAAALLDDRAETDKPGDMEG